MSKLGGKTQSSGSTATFKPFQVRGVLLDMDGTLVDSTEVVERVWADFAANHDIDLAALLAYSHGRQAHDTIRHFLPEVSAVDEMAAQLLAREVEETDGIAEIPGAAALLESLDGVAVAVVTSAPYSLAESRFEAAGLIPPAVMICALDVPRGKPDPSGYLMAAERLGVAIADCAVFEDAEAGLQAGLASGARTVVVGGYESETTRELTSLPDLTHISATADAEGWIHLTPRDR